MKRFPVPNPAEVTEVFLFLASDDSKAVTGKRFQAQEDWKAALPRDDSKSAEEE